MEILILPIGPWSLVHIYHVIVLCPLNRNIVWIRNYKWETDEQMNISGFFSGFSLVPQPKDSWGLGRALPHHLSRSCLLDPTHTAGRHSLEALSCLPSQFLSTCPTATRGLFWEHWIWPGHCAQENGCGLLRKDISQTWWDANPWPSQTPWCHVYTVDDAPEHFLFHQSACL